LNVSPDAGHLATTSLSHAIDSTKLTINTKKTNPKTNEMAIVKKNTQKPIHKNLSLNVVPLQDPLTAMCIGHKCGTRYSTD